MYFLIKKGTISWMNTHSYAQGDWLERIENLDQNANVLVGKAALTGVEGSAVQITMRRGNAVTYSNKLQHTATHSNTQQHTATYTLLYCSR